MTTVRPVPVSRDALETSLSTSSGRAPTSYSLRQSLGEPLRTVRTERSQLTQQPKLRPFRCPSAYFTIVDSVQDRAVAQIAKRTSITASRTNIRLCRDRPHYMTTMLPGISSPEMRCSASSMLLGEIKRHACSRAKAGAKCQCVSVPYDRIEATHGTMNGERRTMYMIRYRAPRSASRPACRQTPSPAKWKGRTGARPLILWSGNSLLPKGPRRDLCLNLIKLVPPLHSCNATLGCIVRENGPTSGAQLRFALDLGTNSIGWAVYGLDRQPTPNEPTSVRELVGCGVRIFGEGQNTRNAGVRAEKRRLPRAARRRRDRFVMRRTTLINQLMAFGLLPRDRDERRALANSTPMRCARKAFVTGSRPSRSGAHSCTSINDAASS